MMSPRTPPHERRVGRPVRGAALPIALVLLVLTGCDSIFGPGSDRTPVPITELPRELTAAERSAIGSSNSFGFDLLREVVAEERGSSVFLSPFSASMALGMTMNGADGSTFEAMRTALRFGDLSEEEINASYRGLLDLLVELDPAVEVAVGNSIWYREGLTLRDAFRQRVEEHFDAMVRGLDFSSPGAASTINAWVRDRTKGRIEEIVEDPIPANIVAYLINATYFKAGWTVPFNPDRTRDAPFRMEDGSTAQIELMVRDDTVRAHQTELYSAADLPYGGGAYTMTVVVPRGDRSVYDLVDHFDAATWSEMLASFQTGRAMVSLPRFELEWEKVLNDVLTAMGMGEAFESGADFSRMFEGVSPWIDEVRQKSFVRVDEEGTEAAAVTSVAMPSSMPPEVRADRPFLFAIRERLSGTILFLGVIVEPPRL